MIATPRLSQIPVETVILGSIGYAIGRLSQVNERLSAAVLAVAGLANTVLFEVSNRWGRSYLNRMIHPLDLSPEALYAGTNALVSIVTILAAQQLDLMSRRVAGGALFATVAILLARVSLLS